MFPKQHSSRFIPPDGQAGDEAFLNIKLRWRPRVDRNPIFMEVPTKVDDYFAHDRHVLCPNYSICLDEAIRQNQYFDCGQCLFKINGIKTYPLLNRSVPENLKSFE